jgi:hypothetical protein
MKKLIQFSTLIDIYESLENLPDIEIKMHNSDEQFIELEYMSLSPIHGVTENQIAIQLAGQPITKWDIDKVVEIRAIQ